MSFSLPEVSSPGEGDEGAAPRYAAFISYSHKDSHHAAWLHRTLESYRLPKDLAIQSKLERDRLYPIFRDEEELAAAPDLSEKIREALSASEALIVICSAAAAASNWVNREIEYFCGLGRAARVFGLLVDGEPGTSFPAALHAVPELFAPDMRDAKNRRTAALKLVAGLHTLTLGQVIERDRIRRRNTRVQLALGGMAAAGMFGVLAMSWWNATNLARAERRDRLLAETRAAFEDDRSDIALTTLAEVWPLLDRADARTLAPVAAAWAPRFQPLEKLLAALPGKSVVRDAKSAFFYDGSAMTRLPFGKNDLVAVEPTTQTASALTRSGKLLQSSTGKTGTDVVGQSAGWATHRWGESIALRNGSLLFAGNMNADKLSEQIPMLLVVPPHARRWSLVTVQDDWFGRQATAGLFLSRDCNDIAWAASAKRDEENGGVQYWPASDGDRRFFRMRLDDDVARTDDVDLSALAGYDEVRPERGEGYLAAFAGRCSNGPVDALNDDAVPALALPVATRDAADVEKRRSARETNAYQRDEAARKVQSDAFAAMASDIQRGRFVVRGSDAPYSGLFNVFPGFDLTADFADSYTAVAYTTGSETPFGYDHHEFTLVCARALAAGVACTQLDFHRAPGAPRFYDGFLYVAGGEVPDDPLFVLVRLPQLESIPVRDLSLSGLRGVDGAATALSQSRQRFAVLAQDELLLFRLSPDLHPTLAARYQLPSLAGSGAAAVTFIGEQSLAIARSDGVLLRFDLATKRETWRLRLPNAAVRLASVGAGGRILVKSGATAIVVDAGSGLPLSERMRVTAYDAAPGDVATCPDPKFLGLCFGLAAKTSDAECAKHSKRCFDGAELGRLFLGAKRRIDDWVTMDADGAVIVRDGGSWDAGAPPQEPPLDWDKGVPCATGWRVEGGAVRRFDPFAIVAQGQAPVPVAAILKQCTERPA